MEHPVNWRTKEKSTAAKAKDAKTDWRSIKPLVNNLATFTIREGQEERLNYVKDAKTDADEFELIRAKSGTSDEYRGRYYPLHIQPALTGAMIEAYLVLRKDFGSIAEVDAMLNPSLFTTSAKVSTRRSK